MTNARGISKNPLRLDALLLFSLLLELAGWNSCFALDSSSPLEGGVTHSGFVSVLNKSLTPGHYFNSRKIMHLVCKANPKFGLVQKTNSWNICPEWLVGIWHSDDTCAERKGVLEHHRSINDGRFGTFLDSAGNAWDYQNSLCWYEIDDGPCINHQLLIFEKIEPSGPVEHRVESFSINFRVDKKSNYIQAVRQWENSRIILPEGPDKISFCNQFRNYGDCKIICGN